MDGNPYDGNTGPLTKRLTLAKLHGDGLRLIIYSGLARKSLEKECIDLCLQGISKIREDPDKALVQEQRIKTRYGIKDISIVSPIIESSKNYNQA